MTEHSAATSGGRQRWQERYDASRLRDADFSTLSGVEVEPVYGPASAAEEPAGFERIGWPGEFPFTRGLHASGAVAQLGLDPPATS